MKPIIAFCGLNCSECEAFLATQANDEAAKQRVAEHWRTEYHAPSIDVAYVTCDSCLAFDGRLGGHCLECNIRQCGVAKGVANCGECPDYACEKLAGFLSAVPPAKATLDQIHNTRTSQ